MDGLQTGKKSLNEPLPPAPGLTKRRLQTGKAKVTIVANQKTLKNVKADDYWVGASFDVTVKDTKIDAKQTGANKITVTGADLTDKTADYVVKRGTVTLSIKEAKLSEDKKSVVLTSASSNMPKGDYTLSFNKGDAVAFTVEEAKVAKIVIDPEVAVLAGANDTTHAYAYYKVFNQFDEDVTTGTLGNSVTATGSDNATINPKGRVVFTNANGYTMNLSQVSLALVCNTNGVNATKVLTVGEASKLASVELKGLYKLQSGKYVEATLNEGADNSTLPNIKLVFGAKDQYGRAYQVQDAKLTVNLLSTTGLACATDTSIDVDGDGVNELAFKLKLADSWTGKLGAGDVQVMTVCLNNGAQTKDTITVKANVKIDSLTITEKDGVYGGQDNELSFEALDTTGKAVTDFATLKALNSKFAGGQPRFVRNADGSAKLMYVAAANNTTVNTPAVITFLSDTGKFSTCNISIQPNCVPKAIIGIKDSAVRGFITGGNISITRADLDIQDQYGNIMKESTSAGNSLINVVTVSAVVVGTDNVGVTTNSTRAYNGVLVSASTPRGETKKTTIKVAIDGVDGSDFTFDVYFTAIDDLTDFTVGDLKYVQAAGSVLNLEAPVNDTVAGGKVYGFYNGAKVRLQPTDYVIFNNATANTYSVTVPAINATSEGYVEKDGKFTVRINNSLATEIVKEYKYSNKSSAYTFSDTVFQTYIGKVDVASNGAVDVNTELQNVPGMGAAGGNGPAVSIVDQYGATYGGAIYYTVTGLPTGATITNNGKTNPSIDFKGVAGEHSLTVKYTLATGVSYTTTIVFNAQ